MGQYCQHRQVCVMFLLYNVLRRISPSMKYPPSRHEQLGNGRRGSIDGNDTLLSSSVVRGSKSHALKGIIESQTSLGDLATPIGNASPRRHILVSIHRVGASSIQAQRNAALHCLSSVLHPWRIYPESIPYPRHPLRMTGFDGGSGATGRRDRRGTSQ